MFNINIRLEYGWRLYNHGKINLWFSGYLAGSTVPEKTILDSIDFLDDKVCSIGFLSKWVNTLDGHFAFILEVDNSWCFIATDKICSIPVFNAYCDGKYTVSNHAPYLKSLLNIGNDDVIPDLGILDSQGIISFIVWIESEFDVIIPTDEVNLDNLGTINCIIDYIAKKNNESK